MTDAAEVVHNETERRFEAVIGGQLAQLAYEREAGRLVLVHTEVPAGLEGRGVGGAMVTAAIDHAAQHGLTVVPSCPFARRWLEHHPDVAGRVEIEAPTAPD